MEYHRTLNLSKYIQRFINTVGRSIFGAGKRLIIGRLAAFSSIEGSFHVLFISARNIIWKMSSQFLLPSLWVHEYNRQARCPINGKLRGQF